PRRNDPRIHGRCMTAQVLAPHRRTARPACATTSLTHLYAPRRGAPESPVHAGRLTPRRIRAGVPMGLHGKIAIVTGASAGIGRAYALALAGAGATVIGAARTLGRLGGEPERNTLEEVVQAGEALPGRIHARVCDVELEADITRMISETAANFGPV